MRGMAKRRIPIDWDDLEMALTMHMDEGTFYLDLKTGQVQLVQVFPFEEGFSVASLPS